MGLCRKRGNDAFDRRVYFYTCLFIINAGVMGLFSAGRGPRSFGYEPRYYDPDEEDERDIKRRMKSRGARERQRSPISLLMFLGLLLLTLLIYQAL